MIHESKEDRKIEILDTEQNFKKIYDLDCVPIELLEEVKNADILIIPHVNFRKGVKYCFPEKTMDLYDYFKESSKEQGFNVEICASDDNYNEIELHSSVINLAMIIVSDVYFQIAVGLVTNYLYERVKGMMKKPKANINIVVEKNGNSKMVKFEGNIESFERAAKSIDKHIFK